ncbi:MAG: hypothetical protein NUV54_00680 [Candidatus Taylorbacteria bacterium]|nr:hypothetical protein [Candidatus Taylorbacteria bacterium]
MPTPSARLQMPMPTPSARLIPRRGTPREQLVAGIGRGQTLFDSYRFHGMITVRKLLWLPTTSSPIWQTALALIL